MRNRHDLPFSPFTTRQALGFGVSESRLRLLVARGELRRLVRGVYADASSPDTPELRCLAVSLVTPEGAVICDRTAAWILGVDTLAYWELDRPLPIETVVPPGFAPPRRSNVHSGERALDPNDVEEISTLIVTTALRTAMDLGCKLRRHHAMASIDALMRVGGFSPARMSAELPRFRRRRGVIQLRELIEKADAAAESPGESWLRLAIVDAGLPIPVAQYWVEDDGIAVYRLDLAYPKLRICVEFDGREHHSSPTDRHRDEVRRRWLRARGWHVIVVRTEDLHKNASQAWLDELRGAIRQAEQTTFRPGRYDVPRDSGGRMG